MAESQSQPSTRERIEDFVLSGPPYFGGEKMVLTKTDIADELDVSRETVRKQIADIDTHPMIRTDTVGQATVYWRANHPDDNWGAAEDENFEEIVEEFVEHQELGLILRRALWLDARQDLLEDASNPVSVEKRTDAWDRLIQYLKQVHLAGRVNFDAALSEKSIPEEYEEVDLSEYGSDGELFRHHGFGHLESIVFDAPLFSSPAGVELEGVVMLLVHHLWLSEKTDVETPDERVDEILPSAKDIAHAGAVFDRFVAQLHGFDW